MRFNWNFSEYITYLNQIDISNFSPSTLFPTNDKTDLNDQNSLSSEISDEDYFLSDYPVDSWDDSSEYWFVTTIDETSGANNQITGSVVSGDNYVDIPLVPEQSSSSVSQEIPLPSSTTETTPTSSKQELIDLIKSREQ